MLLVEKCVQPLPGQKQNVIIAADISISFSVNRILKKVKPISRLQIIEEYEISFSPIIEKNSKAKQMVDVA